MALNKRDAFTLSDLTRCHTHKSLEASKINALILSVLLYCT